MPAVPAESEKEPAPCMYVAAVPAESQKESEILQNQVLNMRKHRIKQTKLTIIAKIRETHTRFLQHTSIHDKLGWLLRRG